MEALARSRGYTNEVRLRGLNSKIGSHTLYSSQTDKGGFCLCSCDLNRQVFFESIKIQSHTLYSSQTDKGGFCLCSRDLNRQVFYCPEDILNRQFFYCPKDILNRQFFFKSIKIQSHTLYSSQTHEGGFCLCSRDLNRQVIAKISFLKSPNPPKKNKCTPTSGIPSKTQKHLLHL